MARTPVVIGVAGGSGSGKTTVVRRIVDSLGPEHVVVLEHDRYYQDRNDLRLEERAALNYDHPDSLETSLLVRHLQDLKAGQPVEVPLYDFTSHARRGDTQRCQPRRAIIVEGILVFVDPALRNELDVKIFVDTDADIRVFRRIRRDIEQRGRTFQAVRDQYYKTVRPMHLQFVEPSKRWADLIIPEGGENRVALDLIIGRLQNLVGEK